MKITVIVSLLAILLTGAGCVQQAASPQNPASKTSAAAVVPASNKFVDQPYYQNTYLISADTLTPDAQSALSGFKMTKTSQPDGTVRITLEALKAGYQNQQYDLKPGEKLYLIESYLQDDDPVKSEDKKLIDDQAVVVDAEGNVIQGPANWNQAPQGY